ncbi:hypothetical protein [uncultured Megasphaera sp.]|uniref:hypothetical protein n=1 Tax=uncultured Megasphaera sp. TaxID=165188 RepID=UPI002622ACE3|nr:hypothetical protein [uncultured Megasphaera sp.]
MSIRKETLQLMKAYEGYFQQYPEERRKYELREKAIRDYHSDMQENRELGREEGENNKAKAVVFNMLRLGMDMEQIMAVADVTQREVEELRRTLEEGTT